MTPICAYLRRRNSSLRHDGSVVVILDAVKERVEYAVVERVAERASQATGGELLLLAQLVRVQQARDERHVHVGLARPEKFPPGRLVATAAATVTDKFLELQK